MTIDHSNTTIIIPRRGINDEGKGKKHALYRLISAAQTAYVWLQDDDVIIHSPLAAGHTLPDSDLLILPLRMESESDTPTLLERLQIAEYAAIQQLTIQAAQQGRPIMCSGANMIVNRVRWLESYPDLRPTIPSGDDMFLLESFKRRALRITAVDSEEMTAIVRPQTSWRAFLRQRMRWAGKAPNYTDQDILRSGSIILIANILQLFFPLVILIKFPLEYHLIRKRDRSIKIGIVLLLELLYPFYILLCLIGGLFRKEW